jgi:hypothetical protein
MKMEITQECLAILLGILVVVFGINFVSGCWEYRAHVKAAEIRSGQ